MVTGRRNRLFHIKSKGHFDLYRKASSGAGSEEVSRGVQPR